MAEFEATDRLDEVPSALGSVRSFCAETERAVREVFGSNSKARKLYEELEECRQSCERLYERGRSLPTIAIVGKVGAGKGWLTRCFLLVGHHDNSQVLRDIPCGQNEEDRSRSLIWIGPECPAGLDKGMGETYRRVSEAQMLYLGCPYVVGDAPGFTADVGNYLTNIAITSATIKIFLLHQNDIRAGEITQFIRTMAGSIVLPVIRFRAGGPGGAHPAQELSSDVSTEFGKWQDAAREYRAKVLDPCFIPDQDIFSPGDPAKTIELVQDRIRAALRSEMTNADPGRLLRTVEHQIDAQKNACVAEMTRALGEFVNRVAPHVEIVQKARRYLLESVVREILGTDSELRALFRRRIRADWMERTPAWCFPYRTFLGVLILTAGAWDRLLFTVAGSLPSLAMTIFQSIKNLIWSREGASDAVEQRLEQLAQDELRPKFENFFAALDTAAGGSGKTGGASEAESVVRVKGIKSLEVRCREIMQQKLAQWGSWSFTPTLVGGFATLVFLLLLAGPLVTIYRPYLSIATSILGGNSVVWHDFPAPTFSTLVSYVLLSAAPAFVIALLALAWACRSAFLDRLIHGMRDELDKAIAELKKNGSLRLDLEDAHFDAAKYLVQLCNGEKTFGKPAP